MGYCQANMADTAITPIINTMLKYSKRMKSWIYWGKVDNIQIKNFFLLTLAKNLNCFLKASWHQSDRFCFYSSNIIIFVPAKIQINFKILRDINSENLDI